MSTPTIPSYGLDRPETLSMPFRFLTLERTTGVYNPSQPHRHTYYEIFYFVHGKGTHALDFRTYEIHDHSIHFVTPGQVHLVSRSPDSHGYILLFSDEFYAFSQHTAELASPLPYLGHDVPAPILYPSPVQQKTFLEIIERIQDEFEAERSLREEALRSYLHLFLVHAQRMFETSGTQIVEMTAARELIQRLRALIEQNYTTIHAPSAYARMMGVSLNHLNTTIRKALGRTIGELIHDRIVLEAKRLLFNTTMSIKQITFQLNYDDPSYFARFFKRQTGVSPLKFRETTWNTQPLAAPRPAPGHPSEPGAPADFAGTSRR